MPIFTMGDLKLGSNCMISVRLEEMYHGTHDPGMIEGQIQPIIKLDLFRLDFALRYNTTNVKGKNQSDTNTLLLIGINLVG